MTEHTSKDLSQRLYDRGFRAEHGHEYRIFTKQLPTSSLPDHVLREVDDDNDEHGSYYESIPAYTFTELWAVVPVLIDINEDTFYLTLSKGIKWNNAMYARWFTPEMEALTEQIAESPAEALGLLVEWLIDNGHIEVSHE